MKKWTLTNTLTLLGVLFVLNYSQGQRKIFGKVYSNEESLENVQVSVKGTDVATTTNAEGEYEITAETEDELRFMYEGMRPLLIKVEDVTRVLNISMIPIVIELENVTVEGDKNNKRDLEKEYGQNENIINTAYGYIDAKVSATSVNTIRKRSIRNAPCILDVLRSRFAGIGVTGDCVMGGSITGREGLYTDGTGSNVIFDIDGRITSEVPIWLNPSTVERMAVLNGRASAGFYSNLGVSAVVIINTSLSNPANQKISENNTNVRDYIEGPILSKREIRDNSPTYLNDLYASVSLEQAQDIFEKYRERYSTSPYFFLDAYEYFSEQRENVIYADEIVQNANRIIENSIVAMKALAYLYEAQGRFKKAHDIHALVYKKRPKYAQSYFDMANSYRNIGDIQKSVGIYARYNDLLAKGLLKIDTVRFSKIISREYNNLLTLNKLGVEKNESNQHLREKKQQGRTRLVFEWNDSEAEFELSFIDPDQNLYEWKHSLATNAESVKRSKDYGYNITEKALEPSLRGNYEVFTKYLGNKSLTPTYLKVTIYHNYGSANQKREIRVCKMSLKNINQELVQINNDTDFVSLVP